MSDYKVKLVRAATANLSTPSNGLERVVFDVTPDFSESRQVQYRNNDATHAPGQMYMYGMTSSRTFSISGKFVSRSPFEATRTLSYIQYLRTWCLPVFGAAGTAVGENILGAPPAVLLLSAYAKQQPTTSNSSVPGSPTGDGTSSPVPAIGGNIYNIPVVITNLDIPYPSDVDYIPTVTNIPVPTIVTVTISLVETHSPKGYQTFSLAMYKAGTLPNF